MCLLVHAGFVVKAFVVPINHGASSSSCHHMPTTSTTSTSMNMIMDAAAIQEIEAARAAFVLCFFGAVGSAAVGREGTYAI